jgi:SAM-dependent methyltransferase
MIFLGITLIAYRFLDKGYPVAICLTLYTLPKAPWPIALRDKDSKSFTRHSRSRPLATVGERKSNLFYLMITFTLLVSIMTEGNIQHLLPKPPKPSFLRKIFSCCLKNRPSNYEPHLISITGCKSFDSETLKSIEFRVRDFAADRIYLIGNGFHRMFALFQHVTIEEECMPNCEGKPGELEEELWRQRYLIFSKFDEGVKLDRDSWRSTTHEKIARYIAKYLAQTCAVKTVLDALCGVGGNTIQFARLFKVYSIDIDPVKINYAKHNAQLYNVMEKIEFIEGNFLELDSKYKADIAFLAPDYTWSLEEIDLSSMSNPDFVAMIQKAQQHCSNILVYLPPTVNPHQFADLIMRNTDIDARVEFRILFSEGKLKAVTCMLGNLANLPLRYIKELIASRLNMKKSQMKLVEEILPLIKYKKAIYFLTQIEDQASIGQLSKQNMADAWFNLIKEDPEIQWAGPPVLHLQVGEGSMICSILKHFEIYYIEDLLLPNTISNFDPTPVLEISSQKLVGTWSIAEYICKKHGYYPEDPEQLRRIQGVCEIVNRISAHLKENSQNISNSSDLKMLYSMLGSCYGCFNTTLADFYVIDLLERISSSIEFPFDIEDYLTSWRDRRRSLSFINPQLSLLNG